MDEPVRTGLRERFVTRADPRVAERDVSEGQIRSSLKLTIETRDRDRTLVTEVLGYRVSNDFEDDSELATLIDHVADYIAFDAEGDRWTNGDGWREYRT